MSLFFLSFTLLTLLFSHFRANRTKPENPDSFEWTHSFSGNLSEFTAKLENFVSKNSKLLILERTKTKFIISESSRLFDFGRFYHIQCKESKDGLEIKIHIQSKLVDPISKENNGDSKLISEIEGNDVG